MGTRTDLLRAAERAAEIACDPTLAMGARHGHLTNAKTALEAAALVEDIGPGEISAALGQIQDLLEEGGVLAKSVELPPAEFLRQTFGALLAWRKETLSAQGYEVAYDQLRELLEGLERDFVAGDTETSRRIAGRIRGRLDDVTAIVNQATGGRDSDAPSA